MQVSENKANSKICKDKADKTKSGLFYGKRLFKSWPALSPLLNFLSTLKLEAVWVFCKDATGRPAG